MTTIRAIPGFDGYFASDAGHIFTAKKKGGNVRVAGQRGSLRDLKSRPDTNGYLYVALDQGGRVLNRAVHRLVLMAFIGPCPPGMEACHFPDRSHSNNKIANLRWDTHEENMRDKVRGRGEVTHKTCRRCRRLKAADEFYGDKRASDGLKTECKRCHSLVSMATRDPVRRRKMNREWMRRNRTKH